jgi:hypothetical protein
MSRRTRTQAPVRHHGKSTLPGGDEEAPVSLGFVEETRLVRHMHDEPGFVDRLLQLHRRRPVPLPDRLQGLVRADPDPGLRASGRPVVRRVEPQGTHLRRTHLDFTRRLTRRAAPVVEVALLLWGPSARHALRRGTLARSRPPQGTATPRLCSNPIPGEPGRGKNYRQQFFLLTDDLASSVAGLIQAYLDRCQIEFNHHDARTVLGIGEALVWGDRSTAQVPEFTLAAYNASLPP